MAFSDPVPFSGTGVFPQQARHGCGLRGLSVSGAASKNSVSASCTDCNCVTFSSSCRSFFQTYSHTVLVHATVGMRNTSCNAPSFSEAHLTGALDDKEHLAAKRAFLKNQVARSRRQRLQCLANL